MIKTPRQRCSWSSACGAGALLPDWRLFDHTILLGGTAGFLVADSLKHAFNPAGAAVVLATSLVVSIYLVSTFTLAKLERWFRPSGFVFGAHAGELAPIHRTPPRRRPRRAPPPKPR